MPRAARSEADGMTSGPRSSLYIDFSHGEWLRPDGRECFAASLDKLNLAATDQEDVFLHLGDIPVPGPTVGDVRDAAKACGFAGGIYWGSTAA